MLWWACVLTLYWLQSLAAPSCCLAYGIKPNHFTTLWFHLLRLMAWLKRKKAVTLYLERTMLQFIVIMLGIAHIPQVKLHIQRQSVFQTVLFSWQVFIIENSPPSLVPSLLDYRSFIGVLTVELFLADSHHPWPIFWVIHFNLQWELWKEELNR